MTAHKDSKQPGESEGAAPLRDAQWQDFLDSHADDLTGLEHSRTARKFERAAKNVEKNGHKQSLLSVNDLTPDSFAEPSGKKGPRDFQNSWLDIDDSLGDEDFVPGPARVGEVRRSTLVFALMATAGVIGLFLSVLFPVIAGLLATLSGLLVLIGGAGLLSRLRGHKETRQSPLDDGARV